MAVNLVQVNGQFTDDNGTIQPGQVGSETGSGVVIGNGYVLTAGHIVFEFNRQTTAPAVSSSGLSFYDYRGYQGAYLAAAQQSLNTTTGLYPANTSIESKLFSQDSVVIQQSGVTVSKSSAGLGAFIDANDLLSTKTILTSNSTVYRDGLNTGHVSGQVLSIYQGDLEFSKPANTGSPTAPGDSGGSYSLNYNGKTYILGTQSSNKGGTTALGTILTAQDIVNITATLTANETGNLATIEPTNLFVGTNSGDTITGSFRSDVILGRDGIDTLDGGDPANATRWGNDQLFGGNGDDTLLAGRGNNLYHGGIQNLTAASDLTIDGTDTVDYSQLTATDPKLGIKIQIGTTAVNNTWKANKDFSHASFVTDLGRDKGVDTLISVEKVTGTSADDIVTIKQLSATTLANANHVGGIDVIDLGSEDKSSKYKGDYVDLSGLVEAAKVTLTGTSLNVAAAADATRVVTIKNDEHILGSKQNDLFQAQGTPAAIDFASGGGHDLVETAAGGTYDLLLQGLKPADVTIIAGGEDLYNGFGDPLAAPSYRGFAFEFVGFKINATGETIVFTDNSRAIGTANTPDQSVSGTDYAAAHSAISSVTFGNGVKWSSSDLWTHVLNKDSSPVLYDLTYRGSFAPPAQTGRNYTSLDSYNTYLNTTYFQADPLGGAARMTASANSSAGQQSVSESFFATDLQPTTSSLHYPSYQSTPNAMAAAVAPSEESADQVEVSALRASGQPTPVLFPMATAWTPGQTSEAASAPTSPAEYQPDLAEALRTLQANSRNRAVGLLPTLNLSSVSNPNAQSDRPWAVSGDAPPTEAVSATLYNRMIQAMAAFHAGSSVGAGEGNTLGWREQQSHSPTLAIAH